ncbi:hypothetical protein FA10DRAFT_267730 [Acaromyces ingoldii]|uniref:NADH dehydrogenase [ubiquinone] 1 beta subcomplex subunit 11, mitochondrial n=1 Tax=Acaromyces ingoldii TaxID=215250 RepID=A0A316YN06_9BASI|nr:hypothetical protein FA10DRAFT_267730 [Acaromyces ingoldii]PWN89135.1 hypothetical protein FA10DRAFT_267730 [Acaromyces ingoldii]
MLSSRIATAASASRRSVSASLMQRRFASGGGGYNQPTGHLFGEKPPPPGTKRAKEDWENLWTYGMFGGMAFGGVLLFYKPDTSIQTWAMAEAKKRLEESGEVWQYKPSPNSGHPNGV